MMKLGDISKAAFLIEQLRRLDGDRARTIDELSELGVDMTDQQPGPKCAMCPLRENDDGKAHRC